MKEPSSRLIRGVDTQKYMTEGARSSQRVGLPPRCMCVSDAPWLADDGLIEDINAGVTEGEEREPHSWLVKSIPEDQNLLWVAFECYSWQWSTRRPLAWTTSSPDLSLSRYTACHQEEDLLPPLKRWSGTAWSPQLQEHVHICLVASENAECGEVGWEDPRSRSLRGLVWDIPRPQRQQVYDQIQRNSRRCIRKKKSTLQKPQNCPSTPEKGCSFTSHIIFLYLQKWRDAQTLAHNTSSSI